MRLLPLLFLLLSVCCFVGCEPKDEELTASPKVLLSFDSDTLMFDTVFVQTGSTTQRLWVYNTEKQAVNIERIELAKASGTQYRLIINGKETDALSNFKLLGNDSLQILVKVTINPNDKLQPFLVTDSIRFLTNGNLQDVDLVARGQNAYFHTREKDSIEFIQNCFVVWDSLKPHVVYGGIIVPKGCTLNIKAGAKIYAHAQSGIIVGGTLLVEGSKEHRVKFQGDRREERYNDLPGQWGGTIFAEGLTTKSSIEYSDFKNAFYGVYIGSPDPNEEPELELLNCTFKNMIESGLRAFNSDVRAINCLFTNTGGPAVGTFIGGSYEFTHCTVANFRRLFSNEIPVAVFQTISEVPDLGVQEAPLYLKVHNSIIWGSLEDELSFNSSQNSATSLDFRNNIIRTALHKNALSAAGLNNQISQKEDFPKFRFQGEPLKYSYTNLSLDSTNSPALNKGMNLGINTDVFGNPRPAGGSSPDLGAIEED